MAIGVLALSIPVCLTACGGDDDGGTATTATAGTAPVVTAETPATGAAATSVVTSVPAPVDSADVPVASPAPVDSSDIVLPPVPDTADLPVLIVATVGVDTGPDRIESVPIDSTVSITLSNPEANDEFHLHGYDLGDGQEVAAGESVTYTFTADTAGEFELESHVTGDVLLVLRVV